jgi:hypothetical protein
MKTKLVFSLLIGALLMTTTCSETEEPINDIYENHDISACGVDDPLKNIEWLREYCNSLKTQDFSSVYIYLYKVIDTGEHVFQICSAYADFEVSPVLYSVDWRTCIGKLIFGIESAVPPPPGTVEDFFKDKEYVTELFHFVRQEK